MPRPALPPTPGSSTDIKGQDGVQNLSSIHLSFELPPPAIHDASRISPIDTKHASSARTASYPATLTSSSPRAVYPLQAAETVKSRRRSSAAAKDTKDNSSFALPPPPTRSRKIIQMKPRAQEESAAEASSAKDKDSGRAGGKGAAGTAKTAANKNNQASADAIGGGAQGKKKQPSATSAAGRKIARKTAHSLIERRRRSKMNEEFAVLKSMIPACTGEMHKLAILQASIDYVRYLEDCVAKLKAQHGEKSREEAAHNSLPSIRDFHPTFHADPSGDVDMSDSDTASPLFTAQPDHAHPSISPGLQADGARHRHRQQSYSSVSTDQRHYSFSTSAGASPAFGPQPHGAYAQSSASGSTLTSPALNPQSDLDQEATAALLMLNNDRRGTNAGLNARGLSVRDLLST
ncbi:HLH transcription factor [Pochonia chlamydosporia 170]|uniref:HLH transcription factor n=1 Tax=Pochonia chlamydosporia 170 TaxID=1380566 RepID=A0A179G4Q4_METCM|nr:HLH transcription factor [Pochonia chlamydosporia 170]OAQ72805.1 HLH transcription factor [Pochonia chlamydosporia 170]